MCVYGFLVSCTALLLASWGLMVLWKLLGRVRAGQAARHTGEGLHRAELGVSDLRFRPARVCGRALARRRHAVAPRRAAAGVFFLANIFYVAPGRTAIVIMPALLVIFGFCYFGWKGVAAAIVAAASWRRRPGRHRRSCARGCWRVSTEVQRLSRRRAQSRHQRIRLELWKKSLDIVAAAPVIGHGTGSIPRSVRPRGRWRRVRPVGGQSAQSDVRGRDPARAHRRSRS